MLVCFCVYICGQTVLWVTFESLKADLIGEIGRIAAFLGIPCNDAMADLVAQGSTLR